ncbi:CRISPR system precrRNA processing endoribonuclease RAMP protein Cas6 [Ureibacillus sp. FSL K6-8385]|uniref:CRISPR system precrRNA processing endoribonuclease RAMP protein Cas6 n=1 Tax=Ureibacillus TaxID=160795 RepID=UPI002E247C62|nr:CRISPR system precrRNA processing endoribonuclease RAMP protein Cas6 [Ureibacillus terrenus]MED3764937.1 CRISPR system precrRNA processing endoribonuclease RAMP protein Cas6 [Ureibacillus terrenus]
MIFNTSEMLFSLPFRMTVLKFAIEPMEEMVIPAYPAITIRGGLGYALKQKLCLFDVRTCREKCQCPEKCSYTLSFEDREGATTQAHPYIPYTRPYIIRVEKNYPSVIKNGELFEFQIYLFGNAVDDYMSYIGAIRRFGEIGFGKKHVPFIIRTVKSVEPGIERIIFEGDRLLSEPAVLSFKNLLAIPEYRPFQLKLELVTPARVKHEGRYVKDLPFDLFVMNLIRRLNSILYFHHQYELDPEWEAFWIDASIDVDTVFSGWEYESFERFSTRQQQKMKLDGIIGEMVVEGDTLKELFPLLYAGQFLHIGKQAAFGFGEYKLSVY